MNSLLTQTTVCSHNTQSCADVEIDDRASVWEALRCVTLALRLVDTNTFLLDIVLMHMTRATILRALEEYTTSITDYEIVIHHIRVRQQCGCSPAFPSPRHVAAANMLCDQLWTSHHDAAVTLQSDLGACDEALTRARAYHITHITHIRRI